MFAFGIYIGVAGKSFSAFSKIFSSFFLFKYQILSKKND